MLVQPLSYSNFCYIFTLFKLYIILVKGGLKSKLQRITFSAGGWASCGPPCSFVHDDLYRVIYYNYFCHCTSGHWRNTLLEYKWWDVHRKWREGLQLVNCWWWSANISNGNEKCITWPEEKCFIHIFRNFESRGYVEKLIQN